jgi:holin-like protein
VKKKFVLPTLRILKEISIIVLIYLVGEAIVSFLDINFPGSIVGMLLLLLALQQKWLKLEDIRTVSTFLLGYMPLFFIPAGVSIMSSYTLMQGHYVKIVLIVITSTFVVMSLTALFLQFLANRRKK